MLTYNTFYNANTKHTPKQKTQNSTQILDSVKVIVKNILDDTIQYITEMEIHYGYMEMLKPIRGPSALTIKSKIREVIVYFIPCLYENFKKKITLYHGDIIFEVLNDD